MADRYEQMAAKLLDSGSDTEPCTSFISALAVSRQSSTSQKADPEFVLKPIAEGLLHNIAQLVVSNLLVLRITNDFQSVLRPSTAPGGMEGGMERTPLGPHKPCYRHRVEPP